MTKVGAEEDHPRRHPHLQACSQSTSLEEQGNARVGEADLGVTPNANTYHFRTAQVRVAQDHWRRMFGEGEVRLRRRVSRKHCRSAHRRNDVTFCKTLADMGAHVCHERCEARSSSPNVTFSQSGAWCCNAPPKGIRSCWFHCRTNRCQKTRQAHHVGLRHFQLHHAS